MTYLSYFMKVLATPFSVEIKMFDLCLFASGGGPVF